MAQGETADLGAGDGRDSLFIASHGGTVFAFDISGVGLQRILEAAAQLGVEESVHIKQVDLSNFTADTTYQNALSAYTL